jgi:hypothetical protein
MFCEAAAVVWVRAASMSTRLLQADFLGPGSPGPF